MGNCTASKLVSSGGELEDAVALCKERKHLLKSAVERRHALADAHHSYILSLRSVAAALNLYVVRHSSPSAPLLIALPSASSASPPHLQAPPPSLLRHTPTEPKTQSLAFTSSSSFSASSTFSSSSSSCFKEEEEMRCVYFFSSMPPVSMPMATPPSPVKDFGWDFFNPFDGVRAAEEDSMLAGLCRSSDEDLRVVREEEGIPDLEEAEDEDKRVLVSGNNNGEVVKTEKAERAEKEEPERGLAVAEPPEKGRELLDGLRDVEDQFIRAYYCGKEVSKMLEI